MQMAGCSILTNIVDLAVVGFAEVLKNLWRFRCIFKDLLEKIDKIHPDLAILVDYPGFNLRLAKELRLRNIPVIYYISPQIWAWGKTRIKLIKRYVNKVIVFFKFEEQLYQENNIPVDFVGHPFLDTVRPTPKLDITQNKTTFALLPGSRENEVKQNLPIMLETAKLLKNKIPGSLFLILATSVLKKELYQEIIEGSGYFPTPHSERSEESLPLVLLFDKTHEGLSSSDFALVASGSATLETAISGVPFVIIYKINLLTWFFIRSMIKIPYIGMVNVVLGKKVVEEFIQFNAQSQRIARYIINLLNNQEALLEMKANLAKLKKLLGEKGATKQAAQIIIDFLGEEDKKLSRLYQEIHQTNQKLLRHFRRRSFQHLPPYQQ